MHHRLLHRRCQGHFAKRLDKVPQVPKARANKYLRTYHRFDHGFRRPYRVPVRPIGRRPEYFGDKPWWRKVMGWPVQP